MIIIDIITVFITHRTKCAFLYAAVHSDELHITKGLKHISTLHQKIILILDSLQCYQLSKIR